MNKQKNAETIYIGLRAGGLTHEAACAMLGNWEAESALRPDNVEDRLHTNTGMTDAEYTAAVDNEVGCVVDAASLKSEAGSFVKDLVV